MSTFSKDEAQAHKILMAENRFSSGLTYKSWQKTDIVPIGTKSFRMVFSVFITLNFSIKHTL